MDHSHVMGGSTAARRINCPGSLQAEKAAPEQPESDFARRGSMLHAAMELLITADPQTESELDGLLTEMEGQDMGYEGQELTAELIEDKIIPAWNAWLDVLDTWDLDDWFIEQRVSLDSVIRGAFGTADILGKDTKKRLHVLDWKFGDGVPVSAEGNIGLGFYAGAAMYDEEPELIEFCEDVTGVVLHIVQPRVGSNQVLQSWETTEDWVEQLVELAVKAMTLAEAENAPRKPGPWCQFCRARVGCPAQQQMATAALQHEPKSMTSIELAAALKLAMQLKTWISDVVQLAQTEAEGGASIPGFKLVNKQPRRVWANEADAEKIMRAAKIKVGDMYSKKLISPAQAEKLDRGLYKSKLSDIVVFHSSGLTLVPDSDKRQAVVSGAELLKNALPER